MRRRRFGSMLAAAAVLAAAAACSSGSERQQYVRHGCPECHGMRGSGTAMGPPLRDLDEHWAPEELVDYLGDPRPWLEREPRLAEMARRYGNPMPNFDRISPEQREELARHVLRW